MKRKRSKAVQEVENSANDYCLQLLSSIHQIALKRGALIYASRETEQYGYSGRDRDEQLSNAMGVISSRLDAELARLWTEFYAVAHLAPRGSAVAQQAQKTALRAMLTHKVDYRGNHNMYYLLKQHSANLKLPFFSEPSYRTGRSEEEVLKELDDELQREQIEAEFLGTLSDDDDGEPPCEPSF